MCKWIIEGDFSEIVSGTININLIKTLGDQDANSN